MNSGISTRIELYKSGTNEYISFEEREIASTTNNTKWKIYESKSKKYVISAQDFHISDFAICENEEQLIRDLSNLREILGWSIDAFRVGALRWEMDKVKRSLGRELSEIGFSVPEVLTEEKHIKYLN